eukprot:11247610-Prorocentrum_lima.AAC.1
MGSNSHVPYLWQTSRHRNGRRTLQDTVIVQEEGEALTIDGFSQIQEYPAMASPKFKSIQLAS